jgi:hypothetical protein
MASRGGRGNSNKNARGGFGRGQQKGGRGGGRFQAGVFR